MDAKVTLSFDQVAVDRALRNPKVNNLEGGFQYYAAVE